MAPSSRSTATRRGIVEAARALFARHGYEATSVRQIGAACGLSDAAIYYHFRSKREIFQVALVPDAVRPGGANGDAYDAAAFVDSLFQEMDDWAGQAEFISLVHRGILQGDGEAARAYLALVEQFHGRLAAALQPHFGEIGERVASAITLLFCGAFVEAALAPAETLATALRDDGLRGRLRRSVLLCMPTSPLPAGAQSAS